MNARDVGEVAALFKDHWRDDAPAFGDADWESEMPLIDASIIGIAATYLETDGSITRYQYDLLNDYSHQIQSAIKSTDPRSEIRTYLERLHEMSVKISDTAGVL